MPISEIHALVAADMRLVNELIYRRLHSEVALVNELGHYIVTGGGKRLRPVVVLLSAQASGYSGPHHIELAAVIEFIHTATLLHDDVVDSSELRRGRETANNLWGNEASVLVGDFLYSRSFQMMVQVRNLRVMEILADATNTIAEGEVLQLMHCRDPDTSEERYFEVIRCKTAKLFEAAAEIGAVLAGTGAVAEKALADYGAHLGIAFQLIDDVLDYSASSEVIGKNVGDDLEEGKPTLPLIHAMRHGTPAEAALLREAILTGGRNEMTAVIETIEKNGSIAYTLDLARREAARAVASLADLPEGRYRDALVGLAEFSVSRIS